MNESKKKDRYEDAKKFVRYSDGAKMYSINMLKLMYLVIPFVLDAIITFILSRMKVEEANDKIRAEMKN